MSKEANPLSMVVSCIKLIFSKTISKTIISAFFTSFLTCVILLSLLSISQSPFLGTPTRKFPTDVHGIAANPTTEITTRIIYLPGNCSKTSYLDSQTSLLQFLLIKKTKCNIYDGQWVYDEEPLYQWSHCSFLSDEVSCRRNGRADSEYERWRWEPRDCKIPRFNGTDMLERLRGKRLVFIGDSPNRNQWESLACLLYTSIDPNSSYVDPNRWIFKAKDYDCSVEFHPTQFLVEYDQRESDMGRIINLDKMPASSKRWLGANVMVFDTAHWWRSGRWETLRYRRTTLRNLTTERALGIAMRTWTSWVDQNVDPTSTTVFFRTVSPTHFNSGKHWCYNQTQPIKDESYVPQFPKAISNVIEKSIQKMTTPVKFLNITKLSEYRKDAHQSVYTTRNGVLITEEERKTPNKFADCLHWCVPGVPDTWNQLLYISLVLETLD